MTDSINMERYNRFIVLRALYRAVNSNTSKWTDLQIVASAEGIRNGQFVRVYNYLKDEKLIVLYGKGYTCFISHAGLKTVEFIQTNPTNSNEYFQSLTEMGL